MMYKRIFSAMGSVIKAYFPLCASLLLFCGIIEFLSKFNLLNPQLIPPVSLVWKAIEENEAIFWDSYLATFKLASFGFLISLVLGLVIAFVLQLNLFLRRAVLPLSIFFQTVPIIAIAPLLVIYFGFGPKTVLSSSVMVSIFPILASALNGFDIISKEQSELFRFYKASKWQMLFYLRIPNSYPYIFSGMKMSIGLSIIGSVAGEFVAGGGLGALIDSARTQQRVDLVFASLFALSSMGILGLIFLNLIHKGVQKWRPLGLQQVENL